MILKEFLDLQDDLNEQKAQLKFLLRAFAALATESIDQGLRPTDWEAYQGANLGEEILEKMVTRTEETLKEVLGRVG